MEDSGPVASTSTANDLFGAFYEPLQQASKAARSGREEQVDHLDAEYGLAVSWQRAIAARLETGGSDATEVDELDDDEESRATFQLEANTWALLQALYLERTAPARPSEAEKHDDETFFPYTPPLTLVQDAIAADASLSELSIVKDWLCTTAYRDLHPAEIRKGYLPYTKSKLKQSLRTGGSSADITGKKSGQNLVDSLDPDATNRLSSDGKTRKVLDSEDANYEKALLRSLWEYVRVGELDQAIDMCRQSDCSWRAASLSGGKLYENAALAQASQSIYGAEDMDIMQSDAEERLIQGNLRRKLWKAMCRAVSATGHLDQYEKALYGAISGEVDTVLPVAKSWEDHLWIRTNALLEGEIDNILKQKEDQGNWLLESSNSDSLFSQRSKETDVDKTKTKSVPQAMQDIFNTLLGEASLRTEARSPFHVAQSWLILNRTNDLLNSFVSKLEASASELDEPQLAHLLRFFAHLILFLRLLSSISQNPDAIPELPEAASSAILEAYIQVLQAHVQPSSVIAFYCSSLDESQAIEAYSRYLFSEYTTADILGTDKRATRALDRTERRNALLHTRANGLDLASTARRVVELTLNDTYTELPDFDAATAAFGLLPGQGNDQGTQREQELVRSIEWLTFDPETYPDALRQANALMRYFMCAGSPILARRITFHIPPDLLPAAAQSESNTSLEDQVNEYLDYVSFFACLSLHVQFTEVWSRRPPPTAPKSERMAYAKGIKGLTDNLWEEILGLLTTGWLASAMNEANTLELDAQRQQLESQRIRSAYIPELVFRLHTALFETGVEFVPPNIQRALDLSNIVADERHRLYVEFMGDGHSAGQGENKLKQYLRMVREASLAALATSNDPFVVNVSQ